MTFKQFFLYAAYGLIVSFIFLIILFPKERAALILSKNINTGFRDGQVTIEKLNPLFPPGFKAINLDILFNNGNKIEMEAISIYPELLSLYSDVKTIELMAKAYGGNIDGTIRMGILPAEPSKSKLLKKIHVRPYDIGVEMQCKDMNIKELKYSVVGKNSVENFNIIFSFRLNGNLNYRTSNDNIAGIGDGLGGGSGTIKLSECNLKSDNILLKQIGVGTVNFTTVNIEWNKSEDVITIENLNAKGADMLIGLRGDIVLKTPQENSTLDLKGELQPYSAKLSSSLARLASGLASLTSLFSGSSKSRVGIPFTITGTFEQPRIIPLQ